MIAALGMYDRPETAAANDHFWQAIREGLGEGPTSLTRDMDMWDIWQSPDLLFAQTCGMPYRTRLHGHVTLIGTPDYGLPGCPPGYYNSVFITRTSDGDTTLADYAGKTLAYNESGSQSGWAAPMTHAAQHNIIFANHLESGTHHASAKAVATGRADLAALDALTWRNITRYDDFADQLRVVAQTTPTPALPYITAPTRDATAIANVIRIAIATLSAADADTLSLRNLIDIPASAYLEVPTPPPPPQSTAILG